MDKFFAFCSSLCPSRNSMEIFCKPYGEICTKENNIYGFSLDDKKKETLKNNLKFLKYFGSKIFENFNTKNQRDFPILSEKLLNQNLDKVNKKIFFRFFDNGEMELFNLTQLENFAYYMITKIA